MPLCSALYVGLFGQSSSPGQTGAFGGFGGVQTASPFGGASQPAASPGLFGSSPSFGASASPGGFGAANSPGFGAANTPAPFGTGKGLFCVHAYISEHI